jgi:sugar phosphate isomerase/epimerase
MQLIVFSKFFRERTPAELAALAHKHGFDGWDLCVRPEYPVNPENAATALPEAVRLLKQEGVSLPQVTGNFDLLAPDHPTAEPILAAMEQAEVRLLKLGYYTFDPATQDYWAEVDRVRRLFAGWQELGEKYGVKIMYHTHSQRCLGLNCAALMHLLQGCDPRYMGAYIDPAHMLVEGEEFALGVAMVEKYLSSVALKDVALGRTATTTHGRAVPDWTPAGQGMVNWTAVFATLVSRGFAGPLSVHCEYEFPPEESEQALHGEVQFFREALNRAQQARGEAK